MEKYICVSASGVVISIAKVIKTKITTPKFKAGQYSETILERLLLSEEEMNKMSETEINDWINKSNELMQKVCQLMNKHL